ncbi:MAG: hypothetical protein II997_09555 [Clostridia bacterium]|nr:hypothetical protein [Clostridia bacterium]
MISNFDFVEKLDPKAFKIILNIERYAKIKPFNIGNDLRHVLEHLCGSIVWKYNLKDEMIAECGGKAPTLHEQFRLLRDKHGFIARMQQKPGNETLTPLPVFKVSLSYRNRNNQLVSRLAEPEKWTDKQIAHYEWADNFLRQIGNDFSHEDNPFLEHIFDKTYENVIYALECLQKYLRLYFNVNKDDVQPFNEDKMPIADYEITGACVPEDWERTSCEKEYTANRYEDYRSESVGCSVIRQYPRTDSRSVFLRRAPDVYLAEDNCGSLLNKVTVLSEGGHREKPFYLIAYDFRTKASVLNSAFLATLSVKERLQLCLSYAETLACFHNNPTPIYHRVFSDNCAYYADERDKNRGISTAIIKFEYAKIADGRAETVIGNQPANVIRNQEDKRYIAPEWNSLTNPSANDWSKVDIYALGILFADIMMGKIGGYPMSEVAKNPEAKVILPLLQKMCTSAPGRPDINTVCRTLKEMCQ